MAFTLTAFITALCIVNTLALGFWACKDTDELAPKGRDNSVLRKAQGRAFIAMWIPMGIVWYMYTHEVFPQWLTGVGSTPSIGDTSHKTGAGVEFLLLVLALIGIWILGYLTTCAVIWWTLRWEYKNLGQELDTKHLSTRDRSRFECGYLFACLAFVIFVVQIGLAISGHPKEGPFDSQNMFNYRQTITVNAVQDERVLYENDKNISLEVHTWSPDDHNYVWKDVTGITSVNQLPKKFTNKYRVRKGYDHLHIGGIWFTELHNLSGDIPEGLEDKAVIKITKVTLVSENVSFRDGTNTDIVRSTQDLKRIHIEYEVTNIDELRAGVQNKEELKQFIGEE